MKVTGKPATPGMTGRAEKTNHYDLLGRLIETQDGYDQATRVTYNAVGQALSKRNADSAISSNVYDTFGNLIQTTDELGYEKRNKYDKAGRIIEVARECKSLSMLVFHSTAQVSGTRTGVARVVQVPSPS